MVHSTSRGKAQEWQRRLRRFQKSRQSVAAFCSQEGVSPPSFYLWKKRLAQRAQPASSAVESPPGFRPLRLLPSVGISVQLPGGTQLVVPTTDAESLRLVIETLARVDADCISEGRSC
jgi:hypothetical protein